MRSSAKTAQARPSGTVAMMMTALTKLSNCAASTSRMMTMAKPKIVEHAAVALAERRGFGERDDAAAGRQQRRGDLAAPRQGVAEREVRRAGPR